MPPPQQAPVHPPEPAPDEPLPGGTFAPTRPEIAQMSQISWERDRKLAATIASKLIQKSAWTTADRSTTEI